MQSFIKYCDYVRETIFSFQETICRGKTIDFFPYNIILSNIKILLAALIVFLKRPSEILTNALSNKNHHNMRNLMVL